MKDMRDIEDTQKGQQIRVVCVYEVFSFQEKRWEKSPDKSPEKVTRRGRQREERSNLIYFKWSSLLKKSYYDTSERSATYCRLSRHLITYFI